MQTGASASFLEPAVPTKNRAVTMMPRCTGRCVFTTERLISGALTAEARQHFAEHGWLSVKAVITAGEVMDAKASIDDLIGGRFKEFKGIMIERSAQGELGSLSATERFDCVRKLWDFCRFDARMDRVAHHANVGAILDESFRRAGNTHVPGHGAAEAAGPRTRKTLASGPCLLRLPAGDAGRRRCWIALDPATVENGCMQLLDGGHKLGPRNHFRRRDWQICDAEMKGAKPVAFPLEPGDALFFDGLIPHGTPANTSSQRRRAIQFHYCCASAVLGEKNSRLSIFGGEGRGSTC